MGERGAVSEPPAPRPTGLEDFATALADRYSGRHSGYPAVRLFSAWNEPNLEQFLAPQFDSAGRSVGPALYAPLARAVYEGIKRGNSQALVAIGETSPRGHDVPTDGVVQDSHSPARFARLLSEVRPAMRFDAWAQHPYPPRPQLAPGRPVRWPRVGIGNLERFGAALDEWFGRDATPIWITEYAHETLPPEPLGIEPTFRPDMQRKRSISRRRTRAFGCSCGSSSAIGTTGSGRAAFCRRSHRRSLLSSLRWIGAAAGCAQPHPARER